MLLAFGNTRIKDASRVPFSLAQQQLHMRWPQLGPNMFYMVVGLDLTNYYIHYLVADSTPTLDSAAKAKRVETDTLSLRYMDPTDIRLNYLPPKAISHWYSFRVYYRQYPYNLYMVRDGTPFRELPDDPRFGKLLGEVTFILVEDPRKKLTIDIPVTPQQTRYRLDKELGSGMSGKAYLAYDTQNNDRKVVIKIYRPEKDRNAKREIGILAKLKPHKNIVGMIDSFVSGINQAIVLEYIADAIPLDEYIKRNHPIPLVKMLDIMASITDAVRHLHEHHIAHRDIKGMNILMKGDVPILIDFDLACIFGPTQGEESLKCSGVAGTPLYNDPDLVLDKAVKITDYDKADIYSLGVTFFSIAKNGELPYNVPGETDLAAFKKRLKEPPEPLDTGLSELTRLIYEMISHNRSARPSAEDIYNRLITMIKTI